MPRQRLIQVDLLDKQPLGTNSLQVPPGGMTVPHIRCAWRLAVRTWLTAALAVTAGDACHILLARILKQLPLCVCVSVLGFTAVVFILRSVLCVPHCSQDW